jgi:DNA-directed RNA polymerase sigma subunit (sigma70/sigma32)
MPTMADPSHIPSEQEVEKALTESIEAALSRLPSIGSEVLRLYFGLDGGEPMSVEEIALAVGTHAADVRRIMSESMAALRFRS